MSIGCVFYSTLFLLILSLLFSDFLFVLSADTNIKSNIYASSRVRHRSVSRSGDVASSSVIGGERDRVVMISRLLRKSRDLCTHKMKNRISTSEECDFCGCTFALSFLRESVFQKPLLAAIHRGFIEWYHVTCQINSYRGIHNTRLHRFVHSFE